MSLCEEREEECVDHTHEADLSCLSIKSHKSIQGPPDLSDGAVTSDPNMNYDQTADLQTHTLLEEITDLQRVKAQHKAFMKHKYESLFEGIKLQENETLLSRIYTQLYIIEGESKGVNEEHEVLHMEKKLTTQHSQDAPIYCNDIFNPLHEADQREKIKSVLTKGIAGIGKTVSVQKFILDWAEGTANQDVDFMFVLPFRELNLIQEHHCSLHKLLLDFHPELKDLDSKIYDECKVVFIFDGLDESRITLKFTDREKVSDVTETSSLSVLMSNLIKGDLLPSALIWITSRPAAAHQIPSEYINRVTEIQGFSDAQKEEYFRKRIRDEHQANRIMTHIRGARSLHIMCHIPVFCWISSTVLQNILTQDHTIEIPKTLTEMYIHFLLIQIKMRNQKYDDRDPEKQLKFNREVIVKLSEVAFKQLMKGNVMFYEEDLRECGIDITDASVHSGICTEIFKEESVFHQRNIYSFIHLSFQEFLAAFFVSHSYVERNKESLDLFLTEYKWLSWENFMHVLLETAVDESLQHENGYLDIFLRFLLGILLWPNQKLLLDLLRFRENSIKSLDRVIEYIKCKIKEDVHLSIDRVMSLFHCLLEMNDQTLCQDILEYVKSDKHPQLTVQHCSEIVNIIQMSGQVLDELDLKTFNTTKEGRWKFIPVVEKCRRARLDHCDLTDECCENLASVLQSSNSLIELDLSHNDLKDSGVKLICDGLKSSQCKLEILSLKACKLTAGCWESLASVFQSSNSLRELDLSHNELKDSVKSICVGLMSSHSLLKILRLSGCRATVDGCHYLASALSLNKSNLIELDLSYNDLQDSGVYLICEGLSLMQILRLVGCGLTEKSCESLTSVLQSSNSLRELDLSENNLKDSGVKLICDGLKSSHCQLNILRLSGCMVTAEGCGYLASALRSNPSHLTDLDLNYNYLGPSGVQILSERLRDPNIKLQNLNVEHGEEFRNKEGPQKYACDLTLDSNTASNHLKLSEDNRTVTYVFQKQSYPDHEERFDFCPQVLCRESLTGCCYWEVNVSGGADVSVSYKGINRKGLSDDCRFGDNDKSWILHLSDDEFTVGHNRRRAVINEPKRVAVFLDWPAGILSFFSISGTETLTHIHTLHHTFTEPLYAGFTVGLHSSVSLQIFKQNPERSNSDTEITNP